jgi:hypothetical protein
MAFRRSGYVLTPPSLAIFAVSVILAVIALLVRYAGIKMPVIGPARVFDVLAIAYLLLVVGVVFRRL